MAVRLFYDHLVEEGVRHPRPLEASTHLLRLKQDVPLIDGDIAAVDDGLRALERLCARLADVATPAERRRDASQGT